MKTKRKAQKQEYIMRYGAVKNWRANISVRVEKARGHLPERNCGSWLELEGVFTEPVAGVSEFSVLAYPKPDVSIGTAVPPCIGVFTSVKPVMQAAVIFTNDEFDRLLTLAAANQLRSIFFSFTAPHRSTALIVNIDFSTRSAEEAEAG